MPDYPDNSSKKAELWEKVVPCNCFWPARATRNDVLKWMLKMRVCKGRPVRKGMVKNQGGGQEDRKVCNAAQWLTD